MRKSFGDLENCSEAFYCIQKRILLTLKNTDLFLLLPYKNGSIFLKKYFGNSTLEIVSESFTILLLLSVVLLSKMRGRMY